MKFIIAPSNGEPLTALGEGHEIICQFLEPEGDLSAGYILDRGLINEEAESSKPPEVTCTITSIEEFPGSKDTLVKLLLPGDIEAYIREEEKAI